MEENQNTNEELPPQPVPDAQVKDHSENAPSETPTTLQEINEETPTVTTQPQTSNIERQTSPDSNRDKPQTESMEVHKHPHHVMHKKKWSEYLLEFFMLFLAVFLGFVAENIREHNVEEERAKQMAKNLYKELYADSIALQKCITNRIIGRRLQVFCCLYQGQQPDQFIIPLLSLFCFGIGSNSIHHFRTQ